MINIPNIKDTVHHIRFGKCEVEKIYKQTYSIVLLSVYCFKLKDSICCPLCEFKY